MKLYSIGDDRDPSRMENTVGEKEIPAGGGPGGSGDANRRQGVARWCEAARPQQGGPTLPAGVDTQELGCAHLRSGVRQADRGGNAWRFHRRVGDDRVARGPEWTGLRC